MLAKFLCFGAGPSLPGKNTCGLSCCGAMVLHTSGGDIGLLSAEAKSRVAVALLENLLTILSVLFFFFPTVNLQHLFILYN